MKRPTDVFSHQGIVYSRASIVSDDDPAVQAHPDLFEDAAPVERATARPGEKRATKRPTKKADTPKATDD